MGVTITAYDDETILTAALRDRVGISFGCTVGDCGACKALLVSGSVEHADGINLATLSLAERALGTLLTCAAKPQSPITISLLPDDGFRFHRERTVAMRVSARRIFSRELLEFELEPIVRSELNYSPGQYALLDVGRGAPIRAFFGRSPGPSLLQFVLSADVDLRVGETVVVRGPFGRAYLRERFAGPIVLAATGSGCAALFAILDMLKLRPPARPLVVYLDGESSRRRIQEFRRRQPQMSVHPTSHIAYIAEDLSAWSAYVFGPLDFVCATREAFELGRIDLRHFYHELAM